PAEHAAVRRGKAYRLPGADRHSRRPMRSVPPPVESHLAATAGANAPKLRQQTSGSRLSASPPTFGGPPAEGAGTTPGVSNPPAELRHRAHPAALPDTLSTRPAACR